MSTLDAMRWERCKTRLPLASARIVPSVPRLFLAQLADAHAKGQLAFFGEIGLLNEDLKAHGIKSKSWTSASGRRWISSAAQGAKVRRLPAGGEWIRTISSARADTDVRIWISASKRPSLLTSSTIGR